MAHTKTKIWKKIILGAILGIIIFTAVPVFSDNFIDNHGDGATSYTAFAAEPDAGGAAGGGDSGKKAEDSPEKTKLMKQSIELASSFQQILNYLLWPILVMIGGLLDNSILFGNGMEDKLREIWINIRNIVNIFFVLILLGVAIYNVLGIGEEGSNYSIKTMLPRIVIGIIAVNFSFLAIKMALDLVNVLTVSIFALPDETGQSTVIQDIDNPDSKLIKGFCKAFEGKKNEDLLNMSPEQYKAELEDEIAYMIAHTHFPEVTIEPTDKKSQILGKLDDTQKAEFEKQHKSALDGQICNNVGLTDYGKKFLKKWNTQNAALALAINMSNIVFYEDVPNKVENIEEIAINGIFSMLMYLVYATSFIALFIVLLGRLVFMWVAIAMAPIITLFLVIPGLKEQLGEAGKHIDEFAKQALAPVIIAVVLTIGWIMLGAIKGMSVWEASLPNPSSGFPVMGLGTLQDLIVAIGTVAIVWLGAKGATSGLVTSSITDSVFGAAGGALKFLTEKPLRHMDWIPITVRGKSGQYSIADVLHTGKNAMAQMSDDRELTNAIMGTKPIPDGWLKDKAKGDPEKVAGWMRAQGPDINNAKVKGELKEHYGKTEGRKALTNAMIAMDKNITTKEQAEAKLDEFFTGKEGSDKYMQELLKNPQRNYGHDTLEELNKERKEKDTPATAAKDTTKKTTEKPAPKPNKAVTEVKVGEQVGKVKIEESNVGEINGHIKSIDKKLEEGKSIDSPEISAVLKELSGLLGEGVDAGDIRGLLEKQMSTNAVKQMHTSGTGRDLDRKMEGIMKKQPDKPAAETTPAEPDEAPTDEETH